MSGYNRLKKYRQLKRPADEFTTSNDSLNNNSQLESQNDESSFDVPMEMDVIHNYSSSNESANLLTILVIIMVMVPIMMIICQI